MELEWIDWAKRVPVEGEAMLVIFYNRLSCIYHMQTGSIVTGPYWYDYEPIRWMPFPPMPDDLAEINKKRTAKMKGHFGG